MPSAHLSLREEDVVRLALEFLQNRYLHISQLNVERETGIINGNHSDDALFLRQLILDGQWEDVLEFVQPLEVSCLLRNIYVCESMLHSLSPQAGIYSGAFKSIFVI